MFLTNLLLWTSYSPLSLFMTFDTGTSLFNDNKENANIDLHTAHIAQNILLSSLCK